jgi:hypothetical protein
MFSPGSYRKNMHQLHGIVGMRRGACVGLPTNQHSEIQNQFGLSSIMLALNYATIHCSINIHQPVSIIQALIILRQAQDGFLVSCQRWQRL